MELLYLTWKKKSPTGEVCKRSVRQAGTTTSSKQVCAIVPVLKVLQSQSKQLKINKTNNPARKLSNPYLTKNNSIPIRQSVCTHVCVFFIESRV